MAGRRRHVDADGQGTIFGGANIDGGASANTGNNTSALQAKLKSGSDAVTDLSPETAESPPEYARAQPWPFAEAIRIKLVDSTVLMFADAELVEMTRCDPAAQQWYRAHQVHAIYVTKSLLHVCAFGDPVAMTETIWIRFVSDEGKHAAPRECWLLTKKLWDTIGAQAVAMEDAATKSGTLDSATYATMAQRYVAIGGQAKRLGLTAIWDG